MAANQWKITEETYVIVLSADIAEHCFYLEHELLFDQYVWFKEPDLNNHITAIASLNPPPFFYKHLDLFKGGEKNGS